MSSDQGKAFISEFKALESNRGTWETHWQEIAERIFPEADTFNKTRVPGSKIRQRIIDGRIPAALDKFVATVIGLTMPNSQKWHKLASPIKEANNVKSIREYFDTLNDILFAERYAPAANFTLRNPEAQKSMGAFGTGVLFIDDRLTEGLTYFAPHLKEMFFMEGPSGTIDTVYRDFELTAKAADQAFKNLPETIANSVRTAPSQKFKFLHVVKPNANHDPESRLPEKMKFISVFMAIDRETMLIPTHRDGPIGGYNTFPYAINRFTTNSGEVYGRGPAMSALGSIKMMHEIKSTTIRAAHKMVDPPLLAANESVSGKFKAQPNRINYGAVDSQGRQLVHALQTNGRPDFGLQMLEMERETIDDIFLVNLFQILQDNPQQTATEVLEKVRERGILLSPTLGRSSGEFISALVERELDILAAQGKLPPMPQELIDLGGDFEVVVLNPLARAQRAEEVLGMQRTVQEGLQLSAIVPEIIERFDFDFYIQEFSESFGAPEKLFKSEEAIASSREGKVQAQQIEQVVEALPKAAAASRDFAQAEALSRESK